MSFYGDMQGIASELLKEFKQGVVAYMEPGAVTGPDYAPVIGPEVEHVLDAAVSGVGGMYRDSTLIRQTDKLVTAAVFGAVPTMAGAIVVDGQRLQIVQIKAVPEAGTVICWKIVVRA